MSPTLFAEKSISRVVILHLIAVLFVIFNISDIRIGGLAKLIPLFDLMMVFYFAVFRRTFGMWFIFLLGIWNDALNGNPLGLTPLCYITLIKIFITLNQRLVIRENFKQLWQQFAIFCFCFLCLKWMILSVFNTAFYSVITILVQFVLTTSFYVLMHKFFDYLYQKLIEEN
ncbi:MAG: hypothetical protein EXR06_04185 [Rickettsiales bacterium]|nr:hypothetical protein [Rickettsiales bacterium]